jgi:L-ascorbate metabolism protein UlaG (beta-lactamase superfamily)
MSSPVITLIGGPTALIEASGFRLLTDPTFDPPGEDSLKVLGIDSRVLILEPGVPAPITAS